MPSRFGFEILGTTTGPHGGELFVVQAVRSWANTLRNRKYGVITDVRVHKANLGASCAEYFGYRILNRANRTFTVPAISELNIAITRLNAALSTDSDDCVLIRFYNVRQVQSGAESYVRRFASSFELPISLNRRQLIHDTVGHGLQGVYLPNQLLEVLRTKARLWEGFRNSPAGQGRSKKERELLEVYDWAVHLRLGFEVDSSSNYLFNFVPEALKRRMQTENQRIEERHDDIAAGLPRELMPPTFHQASASTFFRRLFRRTGAIAEFPKSDVERRFSEFSRQHKASGVRSHGLRLSSDLEKIRKIMAVDDLSERARFNLLRKVPFSRPLAHRWLQLRSLIGAPRL